MRRNLTAISLVSMVVLILSAGAALAAPSSQASLDENNQRSVGLRLVAKGLTAPLTLVASPDLSGRRFIVDQIGVVRILTSEGKLLDRPFLDLRDRLVGLQSEYDERGLLGLAFHPGYAVNGRFFVYYSVPLRGNAPGDWDHTDRLSEFRVSADDPDRADPGSERIILQNDHPYLNHNGGTIAFGPDHYLYLSIGDGGNANDVGRGHTAKTGNGQDINKIMGKILRLDVDHGQPYASPRDNPFVGGSGRNEIYAYGFRNPYRFSFDMAGSHQLFVGDAGQDLYEEVDVVSKGGNYGWNIKEGTHCFNPQDAKHPPEHCQDTGYKGEPLIDPVIEYSHPEEAEAEAAQAGAQAKKSEITGEVVVGGYVYRGEGMPDLAGKYVFADWSKSEDEPDGTLIVATPRDDGHGLWRLDELKIDGSSDGRLHHFVVGFGQDAAGEVYVLVKDTLGPTGQTGQVFKLVPARHD